MMRNGGGNIVNIGSMWAKQAVKATPSSAYSMAKAGLHVLPRPLEISAESSHSGRRILTKMNGKPVLSN